MAPSSEAAASIESKSHLDSPLPQLQPVYSSTSTIDDALDAEANYAPPPPSTTIDPEKDHDPGQPPNGGFRAWLQVAGSFFLFFNCWGTINAFGVFQTFYTSPESRWTSSASNVAWIGSIQAFLLLFVGVITGPVYDAGYFRHLIIVGAFLIPFGFMMTSLAHTYWQTMLAQALCIGLGNGFIFVPSVAILPTYFSSRKALANGIAASGSSIGGIIYPIAFRHLQQEIGFAWATRILGFISLVTIWFSVLVMRPRFKPKGKRKLADFSAFKDVPYMIFCLAMFTAFVGFYTPLYYIQNYAIEKNITTAHLGFYLLPILNAASVLGRILPNFVADYAGPLNLLMPCSLITGILALCWIAVDSLGGILAFVILYGFFSGGIVSMPPVAITSLTTDMRKLGTRMGQCFFFSAFGLLCGTPVSGVILDSSGGWLGVQLFSGLTILVTGCLLVAARVASKGWKLNIKA